MCVVVFYLGGKDLNYVFYWVLKQGFEVKYFVLMVSESDESYMYYVLNIYFIEFQVRVIGIFFVKGFIFGEKEKEVEDMKVVFEGLKIDGVVVGVLVSEYQKQRVDRVVKEFGIESFVFVWYRDFVDYMREIIGIFDVVIVGIVVYGFDQNWFGRRIDEKVLEELIKFNEKYKVYVVGEGGEFEIFVRDVLFFRVRVVFDEVEKKWNECSYLGVLEVRSVYLELKGSFWQYSC